MIPAHAGNLVSVNLTYEPVLWVATTPAGHRTTFLEPLPVIGVYRDMFEQSILPHPGGYRKAGAFATSLTAQILATGVLLLIPVAFHDTLNVLPKFIRLSPLPRLAQPEAQAASTPLSHPALPLASRQPLRAPIRVPLSSPQPTTIDSGQAPVFEAAGAVQVGIPFYTDETWLIGNRLAPPVHTPPSVIPAPPSAPVPVGGDVQAAKILRKVIPAYPALARRVRVSGTVHLIGVIAQDGTIQKLDILSGHPLLVGAALDAVRQWMYRPTLLNGKPVEVIAPIDVIFTLQ